MQKTNTDMTSRGSTSNSDYFIKILLLGNTGVGKSSLMYQYTTGDVPGDLIGTAGVDHKVKNIVHDGNNIKIEIWDTAGQERYREQALTFYKKAEGVILVFDLTEPKSYENIDYWLGKIHEYGAQDAEIILLGNKKELINDIAVDQNAAAKLATSNNIPYFTTSAVTAENLNDAFKKLLDNIIENPNLALRIKDRRSIKLKRERQPSGGIKETQKCCKQ